ncbi:MAG: ribosome maturation factor RimM [Heliobacteriaceae bacterium]|jgi:16S rRNA processing protein RimM|nr:ribosome maturation factor RimM [Heliobacteriaceae bacterium]
MNKLVSVGKILNFHGLNGEAKVGFSGEYFCELKEVFIEGKPFKIERIRLNKNFAVVKFAGIDSINGLLEYKGKLLYANEQAIALEQDEFWVKDLVGRKVTDESGKDLGVITGVSNNGADDLLAVKTKSGKISLVPFVKALVTHVDAQKVTINNIEGLVEC